MTHLAVVTRLWGLLSVFGMIGCAKNTDCGGNQICKTADDAEYYRFDPLGGPAGAPVLMWMHASGGTAEELVTTQAELQQAAYDQGFVLVFPESVGGTWNLHRRSDERNDMVFLQSLRTELEVSGTGPVLAGGFSAGSGMVWALACLDPSGFTGFYGASQTIYAPEPAQCSGRPISVMVTHGVNDAQVPIGDRFDSMLDKVRAESECSDTSVPNDVLGLGCDRWSCADANTIQVCLHDGRHRDAVGWEGRVLQFATERAAVQ